MYNYDKYTMYITCTDTFGINCVLLIMIIQNSEMEIVMIVNTEGGDCLSWWLILHCDPAQTMYTVKTHFEIIKLQSHIHQLVHNSTQCYIITTRGNRLPVPPWNLWVHIHLSGRPGSRSSNTTMSFWFMFTVMFYSTAKQMRRGKCLQVFESQTRRNGQTPSVQHNNTDIQTP